MSLVEGGRKKVIHSEAMGSTKEAYLTCLFILMTDNERYGGVKMALGDNYLLGKQEYPQDLLAAKRLLADFKGAPSKVKKASEATGEQGVAFAKGGKGGEYISTCYGCDRKCKGGWRVCKYITEDHRTKVAALDAAGHFRRGNNNNNDSKNKKGTVNFAAGAGKDDDDNKSEDDATKSEDSNTSGLTEVMTIGELPTAISLVHFTPNAYLISRKTIAKLTVLPSNS